MLPRVSVPPAEIHLSEDPEGRASPEQVTRRMRVSNLPLETVA